MGTETIKRLLVIPHVGTAFGHLIRMGEVLNIRYLNVPDVFVAVPETALPMAKKHMPKRVKFVTYSIRPTVTSTNGKLDEQGFFDLFRIDLDLYKRIRPDLIVGDPGIRAGLLGERVSVRWEAVTHGCYLPPPEGLRNAIVASSLIRELASLAWGLSSTLLDRLVRLGSDNRIDSWGELCRRGQILIPNSSEAEPCDFGEHLGLCLPGIGFSEGKKSRCILTLCSSGDIRVPRKVLLDLVAKYGEVSVLGSESSSNIKGVQFLESRFKMNSVVGPNTFVVCHGGHGSLKAVKHASRVIIVPGDLDQLCNALIAHVQWGAELAIGQSWLFRLTSDQPLRRYIEWNDLTRKLSKECILGDHTLLPITAANRMLHDKAEQVRLSQTH